ncbi:zf-HC2 domain-containing protein [Bisgaard Taxon 10/6]|uniref:Zf-HC2 domain-containing protein n=1 Tax=Exercitatus varius TaxID=67857 RepID=A0ABT6ESZ0_9PAST|nr:zf-HC2 domain-containing protein [Exercitatus varius]QOF68135.1 zf-HC2 domain-containing protein [Actinobacillus sp. GY-402]MDG2916002.1 zf-HC2 domain-containing protein [Exercitatus varius]MDG2939342.1 zf-HC2 domain-containing protein [Exercitatus varius]MDG2941108.1 zf-HC2 domain-containing protein [Exercitatus varius]MDG2944776.1 zf-HC2 domain-containing protein [Exercitatus varius]
MMKLNCLSTTKAISDARERSLSLSEKAGMFTHLLYCPYCRAFKIQCENMSGLMRAFKMTEKTNEK